MTHGSLFSGIGGFDLAAEWMGWENKFHCEWNPFGQRVLKHYWPNAESFTDITKTDFKKYANRIDILTGGFPCQPYSVAGKRKGKNDEHHLWPEMLRAIREIQPHWVVGENVFGLINWSGGLVFHEVQTDLEAEGYEVFPYVLPAAAVNAPHRRDRVWFIAHSDSFRNNRIKESEGSSHESEQSESYEQSGYGRASKAERHGESWVTADTESERLERVRGEKGRCSKFYTRQNEFRRWEAFPTQSPVCSGNDGVSRKLDGITFSKWRNESIKAYGNAIVPQVAYEIFKAIDRTCSNIK